MAKNLARRTVSSTMLEDYRFHERAGLAVAGFGYSGLSGIEHIPQGWAAAILFTSALMLAMGGSIWITKAVDMRREAQVFPFAPKSRPAAISPTDTPELVIEENRIHP